ncbi:3-dehydroquinate synthase [Weeksellaceae bacterium TAE3-ERU29]|nr:3-dehydroquinate synthase [Weeksellaceae bacterium TAE3-ERU29]
MKQAPVYFENGFQALDKLIDDKKYTNIVVLVDENTHDCCLPELLEYTDKLNDVEFIEIPSGESSKQLFFVDSVLETFSEIGVDRKGLLINLGGGVITDFGGFVASIYKRGIDFVNIPTTLLSMVDASAGGKTGIDHKGLKNQIGVFAQPQMVIIHPAFLNTLPQRQIISGFAEMLKHGLIQDKKHWKNLTKLEKITPENIVDAIEDSVKIKINVVEQDPTEQSLRKILNAGHTIGHAIETYYLNLEEGDDKYELERENIPLELEGIFDDILGEALELEESEEEFFEEEEDLSFKEEIEDDPYITHGEAVAIGLVLESYLSWQKGLLSKEEFDEIFYHISEIFPYKEIPVIEELQQLMLHDKKNEAGKVKFVMLHSIGDCSPYGEECTFDEIKNAINFYEKNYPK